MATTYWQTEDFISADLFKVVESLLDKNGKTLEHSQFITFNQNLALSPQPQASYEVEEANGTIQISSNILNLYGIYGPLPDSYNEMFLDQERAKNYALREFLNIFHQRLMMIAYSIFTQLSPDELTHLALILSPLHLQNLPLNLWFFKRTKTVHGLETLIASIFKVPVFIEELTGGWCWAHENAWSKLGTQYNILGRNLILGREYFAPGKACDIIIGPITFEVFFEIWSKRLAELKNLCFVYLPFMLGVNFIFQIQGHYIEKNVLDNKHFLGINSFLISHPQDVKPYSVRVKSELQ